MNVILRDLANAFITDDNLHHGQEPQHNSCSDVFCLPCQLSTVSMIILPLRLARELRPFPQALL